MQKRSTEKREPWKPLRALEGWREKVRTLNNPSAQGSFWSVSRQLRGVACLPGVGGVTAQNCLEITSKQIQKELYSGRVCVPFNYCFKQMHPFRKSSSDDISIHCFKSSVHYNVLPCTMDIKEQKQKQVHELKKFMLSLKGRTSEKGREHFPV